MQCTKHHSFPGSEPSLLNSNLTTQSLALKGDGVAQLEMIPRHQHQGWASDAFTLSDPRV